MLFDGVIILSNRAQHIHRSSAKWVPFSLHLILKIQLIIFLDPVVTDPLGDVTKFIDEYNSKYPVHPVFYRGTYSQALNDAKRELKFLLVFLHSETNSPVSAIAGPGEKVTECVNFCRNTLSHPEVIEYINTHMLLWACDVSSPEGYRVSHSINAKSYPIMVMIGLRAHKMIVMGRMEGECKPEELMRRLRTVVQENSVWLNQARNERLERSFTQTLRQQQDLAYEQSLRADQEKERKKQEELAEQKRAQQALEEEKLAAERKKTLIEELKMELAMSVPSEPQENATDAISIVFKLPNGMRITRRFLTSDSLVVIHNFIFCHPDAPDHFEITQNFPKRVLNCGKLNLDGIGINGTIQTVLSATKEQQLKTVGEAGLTNREVLFVSDLDA